jgi:hypothetical protein
MDLVLPDHSGVDLPMDYFAVSLVIGITTRYRLVCAAAGMSYNGNRCEYGNILLKIRYNFFIAEILPLSTTFLYNDWRG